MEAILEQLDVATTAVSTLLELDLVLHDEGLSLGVDSLREGSRDSVMGRLGLCHETLVAFNGDCRGLFYRPLANVGERLAANGSLFGRFGRCPALRPVIRELFQEWRLNARGLTTIKNVSM